MQKKGLYFILLFALLGMWCKPQRVMEYPARLTFVSGQVMLNNTPAEFGMLVKVGDTISTGAKSAAVIQFSESSIISLKENSSFTVDTLVATKEGDTIAIKQKLGSSFNKIVKRGTNYSITTPTSVAAVRGTSFLCTIGDKGSTIKLSSGRVKIIPIIKGEQKEAEAIEIEQGKKVEVSEKGISVPVMLTKNEERELSSLENIALVPQIENQTVIEELKKKPEAERPKVVPVEIIPMLEIAETEVEQKTIVTLKDIERRYGAISVIETTDGKTYTGAFAQKGANVKIFTPEGTITIPSSKIASVSRYRGEVK
ncbi:MAG: FecR domain-containing protein [Spirochaetes bacterium]|nr:FecR domain-containing protein [Spirochaetota bacterium]